MPQLWPQYQPRRAPTVLALCSIGVPCRTAHSAYAHDAPNARVTQICIVKPSPHDQVLLLSVPRPAAALLILNCCLCGLRVMVPHHVSRQSQMGLVSLDWVTWESMGWESALASLTCMWQQRASTRPRCVRRADIARNGCLPCFLC